MSKAYLKPRSIRRSLSLFCMLGIATHSIAVDFLRDPFNTTIDVSSTPTMAITPRALDACAKSIQSPLTLKEAVVLALCHNPKTRETWANVKIQAALVGSSKAQYLPTLTAGASYGVSDKNTSYPGYPDASNHLKSHTSDINYNFGWVLYDFGLRAANLENARQLLNASIATQSDAVQTVFLDTVKAFYDVQAAKALLISTTEAQEYAKTSLDAADLNFRRGTKSLADKSQAQTAYAQATLSRVQADNDLQTAIGTLAVKLGYQPNTIFDLAPLEGMDLEIKSLEQDQRLINLLSLDSVNDLISDALLRHPRIMAAEAQLEAYEASVNVTKASFRPTISVTQTYDYNNTPIAVASTKEIQRTRSFGLQANIPLFDGLNTHYKVRAAEAQVENQQATLDSVKQEVTLNIWSSYREFRKQAESLRATDTVLNSAQESYVIAQERYKVGAGTIIDLLNSQKDLANARHDKVVATTNYLYARLALIGSVAKLSLEVLQ